jgi:hypothetical protein
MTRPALLNEVLLDVYDRLKSAAPHSTITSPTTGTADLVEMQILVSDEPAEAPTRCAAPAPWSMRRADQRHAATSIRETEGSYLIATPPARQLRWRQPECRLDCRPHVLSS